MNLVRTISVEELRGRGKKATKPLKISTVPYGMWTTEDGRQVLFNRQYQPIWQRQLYAFDAPPGPATKADPFEWVVFTKQQWFWTDRNSPRFDPITRKMLRYLLECWGLGSGQILGDTIEYKRVQAK